MKPLIRFVLAFFGCMIGLWSCKYFPGYEFLAGFITCCVVDMAYRYTSGWMK